MRPSPWPAAGLALVVAACGGGGGGTPDASTSPTTGATGTTAQACIDHGWTGLTYASFGQPFMASYCTSCHSTASTNRRGAPQGIDFDTLDGIQAYAADIDLVTGMNIAGTVKNTTMPPRGLPAPVDTDRQRISCWIAYGLPP